MLAVGRFPQAAPVACVLCTGRQAPYGEAVIQALDLFRPLPEPARVRARERAGPQFLAWPSILENGCTVYGPPAKRPVPHPALGPPRCRMPNPGTARSEPGTRNPELGTRN